MADHSNCSPLSILLLLLFLVFLTCSFSAEADDVFIDCGATSSYIDDDNNLWQTDDKFTQNGENRITDSISKAMSTLRVFSSTKKNCYSIPVTGRILVRVKFFYGNYDNRNAPPTFALLFDGNEWDTVVTTNSKDEIIYYEAVYTVTGDATSICVAPTLPGQFPFISAIEVRKLESDMYNGKEFSNVALFLISRFAMGAPKVIRYPEDDYDRIWDPVIPTGTRALTGDFDASDVRIVERDNPPPQLYLNAVESLSSSGSLTLISNITAIAQPAAYVTMYFAEMSSTDTPRTFGMFIDGKQVSEDITPSDASLDDQRNVMLNSQSTVLSLEATNGSTLPPIISGMEIFRVSPPLSNGDNGSSSSGGNGSSSSGGVMGGESHSSKAKKFNIGLVLAIVLPVFSLPLSFY